MVEVRILLSVKAESNTVVGELSEEEEAKKKKEIIHLTWKDYIALSIAALETALLPLVIVIVILFVLTVYFAGHF